MQPNNPTNKERYDLFKKALREVKREEDFETIIKSNSPAPDILSIGKNNSLKGIKIAVIGGGCAGLASAYELRKVGANVTLFEANKSRIGGRLYTYYFRDDLYGEFGGMRFPVSHETVWHYINTFKLNTFPMNQHNENDVLNVRDVSVFGLNNSKDIKEKIYPMFDLTNEEKNNNLSDLVLRVYNDPLLKLDVKTRKYINTVSNNYPKIIKALDSINLRQAMEKANLSQAAIDLITSSQGIDRGLLYCSYIETLREMYSLNFVNVYSIENGAMRLPIAFNDSFSKDNFSGKVNVKMGHRINKIIYNNKKITIGFNNEIDNLNGSEEFDYVICTIPFTSLRLVELKPNFSNVKMQAIRELNYLNSTKVIFLCNQSFWEKNNNPGGSIYSDLVITSTWFPSQKSRDNFSVITASYTLDEDAIRLGNISERHRINLIKRQIEKCYGFKEGYLDNIIVDYSSLTWNHPDNQLGAFPMVYPEQTILFSYQITTPEYNNQLYFAGDHMSTYHGWVQGALQTGMMAANDLLKNHLKK